MFSVYTKSSMNCLRGTLYAPWQSALNIYEITIQFIDKRNGVKKNLSLVVSDTIMASVSASFYKNS